jgi:hypothetical protein
MKTHADTMHRSVGASRGLASEKTLNRGYIIPSLCERNIAEHLMMKAKSKPITLMCAAARFSVSSVEIRDPLCEVASSEAYFASALQIIIPYASLKNYRSLVHLIY